MHYSEFLGGVYVLLCNYSSFIGTLNTQYNLENVGGSIGQDPATEMTHFGLNQPPVSSDTLPICFLCCYECRFFFSVVTRSMPYNPFTQQQ